MPLDPTGKFPELEKGSRRVADMIKPMLPEGVGFTLFLYEFNGGKPGGGMTWLSSSERPGMIITLLEFLDHAMDLPVGERLMDHVARILPGHPAKDQIPFQASLRLEHFRRHVGRGAGLTNQDAAELLSLLGLGVGQ